MNEDLIFTIGVMIGSLLLGYSFGLAQGRKEILHKLEQGIIDLQHRCPHGFKDWDECPDCCH